MFNNVALDVVIGLVFIFLLYSLLASIIQEIISSKLAFRSKILQKAILRMLEDGKTTTIGPITDALWGFYQLIFRSNNLKNKRFATAFFAHPLVKYLAEDNWYSKPDYLSAQNFSKIIVDLLHGIDTDFNGVNVLKIRDSIDTGILRQRLVAKDEDNPANKEYRQQQTQASSPPLPDINPETKLFLQSLLAESKGDIEKFRLLLENWYDETMQRATGWYKRYIQYILLIIGFVLAYSFNVDSIAIGKILSKDDKAREQLVQMAITKTQEYRAIIDRQQSSNSGSPQAPADDTLLNQTYQIIVDDANKASQIMGLGKPWKDTCKICDDSLKNKKFILDSDRSQKVVDDYERNRKASLQLSNLLTQRGPDSLSQRSRDSVLVLKSRYDSVVRIYSPRIAEHQGRLTLQSRCAFIKEARKNKWNKYSPNQAGGWETFAGWLITALAISLGAPFWFDLLSKLIRVRTSGVRKDSTSGGSDKHSAAQTPAPQTINVNTNTGEEAVG